MNKTDSSGSSASTGSEMSRDHLEELSESLAQRWKNVARKLGMKENKIESIAQRHPQNQVEASMEMLKEWKNSVGKRATYAKMAEALENAGRKDLAEMVEDWKPRQDSALEGVSREVSEKGFSRDTSDAPKSHLFLRYEMRNMKGSYRGICLLLTYENFPNPEAKRTGNKTDIDNLREIFETLNFDVRSRSNLDSKETESCIKSMAEMDHHKYDCFVLFICSHGDKDKFCTSDGEQIVIQSVLSPFKVEKCPTLANKPKIFFFNSCRGGDGQELFKYDGPAGDHGPCADVESYRPNEADFCVVLSTVPGYVAIRNPKFGTYYVQSLYKCVETKRYYKTNHLIDILTLVNNDLNETFTGRPNKTICQVSTIISTLDKAVYFSSP